MKEATNRFARFIELIYGPCMAISAAGFAAIILRLA